MKNNGIIRLLILLSCFFPAVVTAAVDKVSVEKQKKQDNSALQIAMPVIIPVGGGTIKIEVINNTEKNAYNIQALLPKEWTSVRQDSHDCLAVLGHGGKCHLELSSQAPYLAKIIVFKGENITDLKKPVAFSIGGYLVSKVNHQKKTATVVHTTINEKATWLYELHDSKQLIGALSKTDGKENTRKIFNAYKNDKKWNSSREKNHGAAIFCAKLDHSGVDWYLPSHVQMFKFHLWDRFNNLEKYSNSDDSSVNRLVQLDFIEGGRYWTSTELKGNSDSDYHPMGQSVLLKKIKQGNHTYDSSNRQKPRWKGVKLKSICLTDVRY